MPTMIKSTGSFALPISFRKNKSFLDIQDFKEDERKMEVWANQPTLTRGMSRREGLDDTVEMVS